MIPWRRLGVLRLQVARSRLRADLVRGGVVVWTGEAGYGDIGELADAIARIAAEGPGGCRRSVVLLERPPAQLRTLRDVPPVKPRELRMLVAHQAGKFFRCNGEPLVTDAVPVTHGTERVVRAAAVPEPLVEAIAAGARMAGLALETVGLADDPSPFALLPTSERSRRERAVHRRVRRLATATAAAWLAVALVFTARLAWERWAVERELAALHEPLAAVLAARRELHEAESTLNVVAADELRGQSVALLAAVTRALPDSAVLTSLAWSDANRGVITGAARRAAEVVAALERSNAVPGPQFEGPVVRETFAGQTWERFTIGFGREGRPQGGGP